MSGDPPQYGQSPRPSGSHGLPYESNYYIQSGEQYQHVPYGVPHHGDSSSHPGGYPQSSAPPGHPYSYYGGSQDGASSSYGGGLVSQLLYGVPHHGDSSSHAGGYPQSSAPPGHPYSYYGGSQDDASSSYGGGLVSQLLYGVPHHGDISSHAGGYPQSSAPPGHPYSYYAPPGHPYSYYAPPGHPYSYYGGSQDDASSSYGGGLVSQLLYGVPHHGDSSSHAGGYPQSSAPPGHPYSYYGGSQDSTSSSYGGAYHGGYSGALSRLQQQQPVESEQEAQPKPHLLTSKLERLSFGKMLQDKPLWSSRRCVKSFYQRAISQLINILVRLEKEGIVRGCLDEFENIVFVAGEVMIVNTQKEKEKTDEDDAGDYPPLYREEFEFLVERVMVNTGDMANNQLLEHFYHMIKRDTPTNVFEQMANHILLMSAEARFFFPYRAWIRFEYMEGRSSWREDYKSETNRYIQVNEIVQKWESFNSILDKHEYGRYSDDARGVVEIARNASLHLKYLSIDDIERTLAEMFPTLLLDIFNYCIEKGIDMNFKGEDRVIVGGALDDMIDGMGQLNVTD